MYFHGSRPHLCLPYYTVLLYCMMIKLEMEWSLSLTELTRHYSWWYHYLWRCLIFLSVRVDPVLHNDRWCPFPMPSTMPVCNTLTDMVPNHKTEEASTFFLQLLYIFRYLTYLMTASRIMVSLTMNTYSVTGATASSRKSRSGG